MSLTGALNNAVSGLLASQRQIEVVSGNVSNAQTPGYTEKNAATTTQVLGGRAAGAQVGQTTRDASPFLRREVRAEQSGLSNTQATSEIFQRVQDLFGTLDSDSALPNQISDLKSKFEQLGVEPGNSAARTQVLRQAQTVATRLNELTSSVQDLRKQVDTQIDQTVKTVNDNLRKLKDLNQKIAEADASGDPTANLKDKRDQALKEISKQLDIQTFTRSDGKVSVFTNQGAPLLSAERGEVSFNPVGAFQPGLAGNEVTSPTGDSLSSDVGGRLGALLKVRDESLPDLQGDLDRLAAQLREEVNAAHNKGTFGNKAQSKITGSVRLEDSSGSLVSVEKGTNNGGTTTGTFEIARVDSNGDVVEKATVNLDDFNGTNAQDLANFINSEVDSTTSDSISGGSVTDFASLNSKNQLELNGNAFDSGPTKFVVKNGDATIESASIGSTASDSNNSGTRERGLSHFAGLNNFFETPNTAVQNPPPGKVDHDSNLISTEGTSAAQSIRVRQDIVDNPDLMSRGVASTTAGDEAVPEGDGSVAKDIAETFERDITFPGKQSNGLPGDPDGSNARGNLDQRTTTIGGFAGDIIQFQASEASRLKEDAEFQKETLDNLEFRAESQAGVNIDEELAQLQQFQQSFNANARLVSTTQQMFQTLSRAVA